MRTALLFGWLLFLFPAAGAWAQLNIGDPDNIVAGATAVASTDNAPLFVASDAVDDLVRDDPNEMTETPVSLIFGDEDDPQLLGLTGFNSEISKLRIWTIPISSDGRIPADVAVKSSFISYSGSALIAIENFETDLGAFTLGESAFSGVYPGTDNQYAEIAISAPAGTQSLLLDFGYAGSKGDRISEVQAFFEIPCSSGCVVNLDATINGSPFGSGTPCESGPHPNERRFVDAGTYDITLINPALDAEAAHTAWKHNAAACSWRTDWRVALEDGSLRNGGTNAALCTDGDAFAATTNVTKRLTIPVAQTLRFHIGDQYICDNSGGVSLRVERVTVVPALSLIGGGVLLAAVLASSGALHLKQRD